jgi:hypothetical protein
MVGGIKYSGYFRNLQGSKKTKKPKTPATTYTPLTLPISFLTCPYRAPVQCFKITRGVAVGLKYAGPSARIKDQSPFSFILSLISLFISLLSLLPSPFYLLPSIFYPLPSTL